MNRILIEQLLRKHLEGRISSEDSRLLEEMMEDIDSKLIESILCEILSDSVHQIENVDINLDNIKYENVWKHLQVNDVISQRKKGKLISLKSLHYALAIASLFIAVFFLLRNYSNSSSSNLSKQFYHDIDPAYSIAKIQLSDGKELVIDSTVTGLVYEKDGVSMYRSKEGIIEYVVDSLVAPPNQYINVTTPKGGYTKITLSDGSLVSLNSASTITYPILFTHDERQVSAEGEIYFQVAKDKNRPFRIKSEKQEIEVLGTSFNLLSNSLEAKTTLIEGSVKVHANNKNYLLKPGQQSIVNNTVQIIDMDTHDAIGWTNDQFVFDNGSFFDLLKEIENWYDVRFVFERADIQNMELSGSLSRKLKLSELLNVLSINTGYEYKIQERRIFVK